MCDDGLGDPMVVGGHPGEYLASSQGERYRLMSLDGDTLTVRIHPYSQSSRDAFVWVNVDAAPVTITLAGPRQDAGGAYECMVGRGVTGTFSAGGYHVHEDSYQWSIGGSTFKDYVADGSQGTLYPVDPQELHAISPHWFWKEGACALVSCSGTVDLPDGTAPSVSAQTACDVTTPDNQFGPHQISFQWYMMNNGGRVAVTWNPQGVDFDDGHCIEFYGSAKTPERFWENGPGEYLCVQLAYVWDIINTPVGPVLNNTDNAWELDNYFPYRLSDTSPNRWPADLVYSGHLVAVDGPSQALAYSVTSFSNDDRYQMYHPTGGSEHSDWAWVPLNMVEWQIHANDNVPWTAFGLPIPGSYVQINKSSGTSRHPTWDDVFSNHK